MNLALANIRKGKSATASLFIFILVAALLLNIGLMIVTQVNPFYDEKGEQLNDPHVSVLIDQASYQSSFGEFLNNYPGVTDTEIEKVVNMEAAKFNFGDGELSSTALFFNADADRTIAPYKLIEQSTTSNENDIYVPYSFKTNGGYKLGEQLNLTYEEKDYQFKIAGFFETTMMGTNNFGVMKFMLPKNAYNQLANELDGFSDALMISAVMEDKTQSTKLNNDFIKEIEHSLLDKNSPYHCWGIDIETVKDVNLITINILAIILVAFSGIIVLVSLIVIKFRVTNNIEDGMANIGVLKAIGYTSRQILLSIMLQFILIAICGTIVGIALSYVLIPLIGGVISTLCGLIWVQNFDMFINLICMFVVLSCVAMVTVFSAFRVRKIQPIMALRGGIQTHSFRKVYLPLANTFGGLHFLLAIKSMISNRKQNIMILLIIISLTFASVFSMIFYYNIATDNTAFVNLFGEEPSNVMISVKPDADTRELLSHIQQMDQVRKVNIWDLITKIDGQTVFTNVTDNFNQLENNTVYEGRQPKHENEISLSWVVSDRINKGIGDEVKVEYGTETVSFLVTGLSQSISNLGQTAALTMDGIQQLESDYKGTSLYVYLDGRSNKDFIENVQELYGDYIAETVDIDENIQSQTSMYTDAVFAMMLIVLSITVLVVVIILYLIIKTMITKRKKEFGVMKAMGYSTIQLMHQISISFVPVIIAGVTIGGILGYFYTNPMLSVFLSSAGVKRLDFIIHVPTILILCVGILILAYMVTIFVSLKIKKISAYSLITE